MAQMLFECPGSREMGRPQNPKRKKNGTSDPQQKYTPVENKLDDKEFEGETGKRKKHSQHQRIYGWSNTTLEAILENARWWFWV